MRLAGLITGLYASTQSYVLTTHKWRRMRMVSRLERLGLNIPKGMLQSLLENSEGCLTVLPLASDAIFRVESLW